MKNILKKTIKFAAGSCAAVGVVALGAVVASGTAVTVLASGFKAAKDAMQQTISEIKAEDNATVIIPEAEEENEESNEN